MRRSVLERLGTLGMMKGHDLGSRLGLGFHLYVIAKGLG
jgi:hypothetical protein